MSLAAALHPRSVVIVGASDDVNKIGGRPIRYMQRFGFTGSIYPLNPNRPQVQGIPTIASLDDLPEVPDMALIAIPGEGAIEAVARCAAMGVKVAVILSSGFAEISDPRGAQDQARMIAAAHAGGMRVIGPNSQGLANFANGACPGFSTMFLEVPPQDGPVGIVSQSGAIAGMTYGVLREMGIGVRYANATGNDGDVSAVELALEMARDPDLRLLLVYIESIADAAPLAALGAEAQARGLPTLVLKGGSTDFGQTAARSHTAALANEDRAVDAFLAAHGLSRVHSFSELVATARFHLNGWRPQGRRTVVISNSGASCVMAADALSTHGMSLAKLLPTTNQRLLEILPGFASTVNPIDITAALLSNSSLFSQILPVIGADPEADAFVIVVPVAGESYDVARFGRDIAAFAAQTGKPVVIAAPQPKVAAVLAADSLPVYPFETEAVQALASFIAQYEVAQRGSTASPPVIRATSGTLHTLSEAESLALLDRHGFASVPHRLCHSAAEAAAALRDLGGPVVIKGISAAVPHKSELGLVRLGIRDADAAAAAFADMVAILEREGHPVEGVLVARMVSGRRELIVGGHCDPVLGPMVVIGDGGKYVETLRDTALIPAPADRAAVERAIDSLRIAPILRGTRGEAPIDSAALARLAAQVAALLSDPDTGIESIDLNPVFADESGVAIADALIVARRET